MEFQVADLFEAVVDNIPSRESIVLGKQRLTFADLDKRANKAAHMLKKIGVRRGEHIGIYAYNCIEWIEVMVGAYKIGAVPININCVTMTRRGVVFPFRNFFPTPQKQFFGATRK